MREDVNAFLAEADPGSVVDGLDEQDQIEIITKAVGTKPGIHISGVGKDITRSPRKRGRPAGRSTAQLEEELNKVREDFAKTTATLLDRIKLLEEMHGAAGGGRPSEGASYAPQG